MTPRERVMAAVSHRRPDRVPVDFGGHRSSGIAAIAETKRVPFDLPEGESEIIGYFVEYSGMRFGLFMMTDSNKGNRRQGLEELLQRLGASVSDIEYLLAKSYMSR